MSKAKKHFSRMLTLGLCIALLLTATLIIAPEVGAASETNKTETDLTSNEDIPTAEADVLTQRAITVDEAKKMAQAAVIEQLAIIAATEESEDEVVIETQTEAVVESTEAAAPAETSAQSSSETSEDNKKATESQSTAVVAASSGYGYLMSIDNPDPNYSGCAVSLSSTDRDMAERILMGEAGSMGYTGMALVAQCLRDTYVSGGYSSIADVIYSNGWYGSMSIKPSSTCKEVISYIFDQGGSAVQHRIRVFYASNYCYSAWHEAQTYVCSSGYVRFFDM